MIAMQVKNMLKKSGIESNYTQHFFSYKIPQDEDYLDKIVVLVNEISNRPTSYGSNKYIAKTGLVQVQIFYPQGYERQEKDTGIYEDKLIEIMENNKWFCTIGGNTNVDPDTNRFFSTFHFQKNIERRNLTNE